MPEISESLSHKIGPLPAWGWGLAIGGAVIVAKMLTGKSAFASGTPAVVGGTQDSAAVPDGSLLIDLQKQLSDLTSASNSATSVQALLVKLQSAINTRATVLYYREQAYRKLSDLDVKYRSGLIDTTTYNSQKATYQHDIDLWTSKNTAINTTITDLQKQLATVGSA